MSQRRMRIVVTNMFNAWNHGEILYLQGVASFLRRNGRDIILSCPYGIVDKKLLPREVRYVGRQSRKSRGTSYYIDVMINLFYFLIELKRCDIVLGAGGDTLSDDNGIKNTFAHCLPIILAHLFSKPVIVLPQTILPFKHRLTRSLAKLALNASLGVFVREKETYDYLRSQGIKVDGVCLDPAFYGGSYRRERSNLVGVNCSRYLHGRRLLHGKGHHTHVVDILRKLGEQIVYVPHVLGDDYRSDYDLCVRFSRECNGRVFLAHANETKDFISTLKVFIGERYHSVVSALSTCTPVLAVSNSFKTMCLMRSLGLEDYLVDPSDLNFEVVFEKKTRRILRDHELIRTYLQSRTPDLQRSVCGCLKAVDRCITVLSRVR